MYGRNPHDTENKHNIMLERTNNMRIPFAPRERATLLILRRKYSYSINQLAHAFNRSVSLIHRLIKFNEAVGTLRRADNRWYRDFAKKIGAARQQRQLVFYMPKWTAFILGESDKPP